MKTSNNLKWIKNIMGFSLASWISALLNFIILPISTRIFEPTALAKINLFYSITTILMTVGCIGLDQGYMRFYFEQKSEKRNALLAWCIKISCLIIFLIYIVSIPFSKSISLGIYGEANNYVGICLLICTLNMIVFRYISIKYRLINNILKYTVIAVVSSAIIKFSYLIASFVNGDYSDAINLMTMISLITLIILCVKERFVIKNKVPLKRVIDKDFLKFSIPLFPLSFMVQFNTYLPQYLIRYTDDFNSLGVFSSAVTLASIITLLQSGINVFWSPHVLREYKKKENNIKSLQNVLTVFIFIFAILILMCGDFIVLLLGEKYRSALLYIPFLIMIPVNYTIAELTGIGIIISKKSFLNIFIYLFTIIINFCLSFFLSTHIGILGISMGSGLASLFMLAVKTIISQKFFCSIKSNQLFIFQNMIFVVAVFINTFCVDKQLVKIGIDFFLILMLIATFYKKGMLSELIVNSKDRG